MTTSKATPQAILLERQSKFHELLDSFGVMQQLAIGIESSETYVKKNSSFGITTILSYDVDLAGVFEEEEKIEGMKITNTYFDNGFKTASFPVIIVTFN